MVLKCLSIIRVLIAQALYKIKHKEFHQTIKKDLDQRSELMGAAYVKDCGGGDRMMKLNTMEGKIIKQTITP